MTISEILEREAPKLCSNMPSIFFNEAALAEILGPIHGRKPSPTKITPPIHDRKPSIAEVLWPIHGRKPSPAQIMPPRHDSEPSPAERPKASPVRNDFLTIPEIATRWRIARPTVYNRLKSAGVRVLDFAPKGQRGRKIVPLGAILDIERQQLKRL